MNKTIMLYINSIHNGGAEKVIINIAEYFAERKWNSILVTSFSDDHFEYSVPKTVKRFSIERDNLKKNRLIKNVNRITKLRELCLLYNPSVLVAFMYEPATRAILATLGLNIKTVVSVRNNPNLGRGLLFNIMKRVIFPCADGAVFQTEMAMKCFPRKLRNKSTVIANPISNSFFDNNITPKKKRIVALGRLEPVKNHNMIIEAFSMIINDFPEYELLIYGEGSLKDKLRKIIAEKGLAGKAFLMGQTDEVDLVLKTSELFVLSSNSEGMPNSLLEAMATGLPCIATDCPCGAPRQLIRDGIDGFLVKVGDAYALAQKMKLLLGDSYLRINIGNSAKQRVREYNYDTIMQKWENYIMTIVVKGDRL